jgi:hypothetical protein
MRPYSAATLPLSLSPARREIQAKGRRSRSSRAQQQSEVESRRYKPGEPVRQSGIYEIIHHGDHRAAHDVVMIRGDHFPPCEACGEQVRFRLIRTAPYIFQDEDFSTEE